jgi:hypothetical protein
LIYSVQKTLVSTCLSAAENLVMLVQVWFEDHRAEIEAAVAS